MKGNRMKMTKKNVAVRLAVATVLSVGLSAGFMGIASASSNGGHDAQGSTWNSHAAVEGVVSASIAGDSISIEAHDSTSSTTYTLTSATTITGLATGASLLNSKVELYLSTTSPPTVLAIRIATDGSNCDHGGENSQLRAHGTSSEDQSNHDRGRGSSSDHGSFRR